MSSPPLDHLNRLDVEAMLEGKEPFRKGLLGVPGPYRHGLLQENGAGVHARVDEVNGGSGDRDASLQGAALRMKTAKGRKERWMHVEDWNADALDQLRAEKPHEPAQGDE